MYFPYIAVKLISLITALVGTLTIARQKLSYFTSIRTYMAGACFTFSMMVAVSMITDFIPQLAYESERSVSTFALVSAVMLGFSAANLVDFPEKRSARRILAAAIEKGDYHFLGFSGFIILGIVITWIPQFVPTVAQFIVEANGETFVGYESWYAAYLFMVVVAIWAYPCYKFFRLFQSTEDVRAKRATFVFFLCIFAITSVALIIHVASVFVGTSFPGGITSFTTSVFYLILAYVFKETKVLTLYFEGFSKSLGLTHQQVKGQRILLEFDPRSDYQKAVNDFIDEATANAEPIVVFTYPQGTVHSIFNNRKDISFFLMTNQVSAPTKKSETKFLLPENASLVLDAMDKTLKAKSGSTQNVVFDNLSNLVLSIGFNKTYNFLRYALDVLVSMDATALFLINPTAHETREVSSFRSLFGWQLSYAGAELQVVKLPISRV